MCGRLTLTTPAHVVAQHFGLERAPRLAPRYNLAPSQPAAIVRQRRSAPERVLELRRWGLVPRWANDPRIGSRLINARAESVGEKPAYREAFRRRRCLVAADGFYEWQPRGRRPKQPYHVHPADDSLFAIAGLYERWRDEAGGVLDTCTLLTAEANAAMRRLHDRMPVILPREDWEAWLDPGLEDPERLQPLLRPAAAHAIDMHPVSLRVNDVDHDDPGCIEPVAVDGSLFPELL